jgi:hypothetical protein
MAVLAVKVRSHGERIDKSSWVIFQQKNKQLNVFTGRFK